MAAGETARSTTAPYRWTFYRSAGVDQVALQSGDDLVHLHELDPKLWIALSMPTRGVAIDPRTLDLLDTDKDGHVRQPEVLAAVAWICALYKDPGRLLAGGDTVALDERETIAVDVAQPDQVRIGLPRDRFVTEESARGALTSRGGEVVRTLGAVKAKAAAAAPESGPLSSTPEPPQRWTFIVKFPPAVAQAALDAIGNLAQDVEIRDARQTVEVKLEDVSPSGVPGGLVIRPGQGAPRTLAPAEIAAVHTMAPVVIPDDAYLLVEGDRPREHAPTVVIALILVMFGAVNLVGLFRELGRAPSTRS